MHPSAMDGHVDRAAAFNMTSMGLERDWRRHGKARRDALLEQDEIEGGTMFSINRRLPVSSYFDVAEKVLSQFRAMYESRSNIEELFVMGHRLIIFLSKALPNHPEFRSKAPLIVTKRTKSRHDLHWIKRRLDIVALRIDEEQLNRFILDDLGIKVARQICQSQDRSIKQTKPQWESFDGSNEWNRSAETRDDELVWEPALYVSFESSEMETPAESPLEHYDCYGDGGITASAGCARNPTGRFESAFPRKGFSREFDLDADLDNTLYASVMHQATTRTDLRDIRDENLSLANSSDHACASQEIPSYFNSSHRHPDSKAPVHIRHLHNQAQSTNLNDSDDSQGVLAPEKENQQVPSMEEEVLISSRRRVHFNEQQNQFQFYLTSEHLFDEDDNII